MGDISKQIESLNIKLKKNENLKTVVIGGIEVNDKKELEDLIKYQWIRLNFLQIYVNDETISLKELIQVKKDLYEKLCGGCQSNSELPCEKDFLTYSFYRLLEDLI